MSTPGMNRHEKSTTGEDHINRNAAEILERLKKLYPDAKIILKYTNPWELLVAVVLSAQCTDVAVNKVTEKLFKRYKTIEEYVYADPAEFEKLIHPTGFFRNKTKNILAAARVLHEQHNDIVPGTMTQLLTIPGIARKSANVILGNAYKVVEGIAVDTHVHRISQRLRLVRPDVIGGKKEITFIRNGREVTDYKKDADPNKIESELMNIVPKADWFMLTYQIIDHGRAICKAQNPRCHECPLSDLCPASRV